MRFHVVFNADTSDERVNEICSRVGCPTPKFLFKKEEGERLCIVTFTETAEGKILDSVLDLLRYGEVFSVERETVVSTAV